MERLGPLQDRFTRNPGIRFTRLKNRSPMSLLHSDAMIAPNPSTRKRRKSNPPRRSLASPMRLRELTTRAHRPRPWEAAQGKPSLAPPGSPLARSAAPVYGFSPLGASRRLRTRPRGRGVRRPGAARCRRVARQPAGQRAIQRRRPIEAATTETALTRRLSAEP
jgi:hypothetical protein